VSKFFTILFRAAACHNSKLLNVRYKKSMVRKMLGVSKSFRGTESVQMMAFSSTKIINGIKQMAELIGWLLLLGLIIAIAGIYMLSSRIDSHTRNTTENIIYSNEMILTELKRLADPSIEASESAVGVILERRRGQRRKQSTSVSYNPDKVEQRRSSGRRLEDMLFPIFYPLKPPRS